MRPEVAFAEQRAEARAAAALWLKADLIDDPTLRKIRERYADDRVRAGPTFRILFFLFTLFAAQSAVPIVGLLVGSGRGFGMLALFVGLGCVALTEYLTGPLKRSQSGVEAATSLLALSHLMMWLAWMLTGFSSRAGDSAIDGLLLAGAVLSGAAAWRWGYWIYALASVALLFMIAARLPYGRAIWIVLPLILFRPLVGWIDSARLAPSHRRCMLGVLVAAILTFYFAINTYSVDHALLEELNPSRAAIALVRSKPVLWLSILLTALAPLGLALWGVKGRRRLLLNLGVILGVFSLLTLRAYFQLLPAWLLFSGSGAAAIAAALFLRRALESKPGKERGGFTAAPLFEDFRKQRVVEILSTVATLTPEAAPSPEKPRVTGGGGEFGGGGASGSF